MAPGAVIVARGRTQGGDRLIVADDALAALQRACGGDIPGTVAIPALLELLRKAWRHRLKLGQTIEAQDGENVISAWVQVIPDERGCALALSNWRATPLPEGASGSTEDDADVVAQTAELHLRLDPRQGVLAVGHASGPLSALADAIVAAPGRAWTEFVAIPGAAHRQPLHWRLLDRAAVEVEGLDGRWQARIVPAAGDAAAGFDLYLVPESIDTVPEGDPADPAPAAALDGLLGRDLAPALRQPIARIIANAETIRTRLAGPLAEEYANYAGDIADAARHLQALVEDLADLDAIEAPGFAPAADRIDLADAARRAAGILSVRARESRIALEVPPEGETVPAIGEWRRVLQVLLNLVGNALRYSPAETTVRLSVARRGERVFVSITDEGEGIAPAQRAKVFEKFERLGRSGDGGSGLGLYISRRLARAMEGELSVDEAPGGGAQFTLELPAG